MGRLSRQIGAARQRGEDVAVLIEQMKELSAECKGLEKASRSGAQRHAEPGPSANPGSARTRDSAASANSPAYPTPGLGAGDITIGEHRGDAAEWDAYVKSHPRSTVYHLHCWRAILESSFAHPAHYLVARDGAGRLAGVLPLVRQKSRLFGHFMTSLPFLNYGGPLGDNVEAEQALMGFAGQIAEGCGCRHVEFRDELARAGWPARTNKVSMRLRLPGTAEELWARFSSKLRSQIRRAERDGPRTVIGGAELLPDFYSVFAQNMRDLGTPVYSRRFFTSILTHSRTPVRVLVTYLNRAPVSAGIVIQYRDRMEIPWASTIRAALPMGINMLFYWRVLAFAIEQGSTEFDFGRSTLDSGPYRFKRQWGAVPTRLHWHYWLPDGASLPELNPANPKFRFLIATWRNLPVRLANVIGPMIARNLP